MSSFATEPEINQQLFRNFLHDVHHAYLLLHRAMQTIPPTMIPNLEPMPHPPFAHLNQPPGLQPLDLDIDPEDPPGSPGKPESLTSEQMLAIMQASDTDEEPSLGDSGEAHPHHPRVPRPRRHVQATDPSDVPQPMTNQSSPPAGSAPKRATKRPAARRRRSRSRTPMQSTHPWTTGEKTKLRQLKTDKAAKYSWKIIGQRMNRTPEEVKEQWNLMMQNADD